MSHTHTHTHTNQIYYDDITFQVTISTKQIIHMLERDLPRFCKARLTFRLQIAFDMLAGCAGTRLHLAGYKAVNRPTTYKDKSLLESD